MTESQGRSLGSPRGKGRQKVRAGVWGHQGVRVDRKSGQEFGLTKGVRVDRKSGQGFGATKGVRVDRKSGQEFGATKG